MTYLEQIAGIKVQKPETPVKLKTMFQFNLLLKSFKVIRAIAIEIDQKQALRDRDDPEGAERRINNEFEKKMSEKD